MNENKSKTIWQKLTDEKNLIFFKSGWRKKGMCFKGYKNLFLPRLKKGFFGGNSSCLFRIEN